MQTTTKTSRLDSLILRAKRRSVYDLVFPALALVGLALAGAAIPGPGSAASTGDQAALVADAELAE